MLFAKVWEFVKLNTRNGMAVITDSQDTGKVIGRRSLFGLIRPFFQVIESRRFSNVAEPCRHLTARWLTV